MIASTDNYAFKNMAERGTECEHDPKYVRLDVWRRIKNPSTGEEDGSCKRERMLTLGEVFTDLRNRLDILICTECGHERSRRNRTKDGRSDYGDDPCKQEGCTGHYESLIDEYFSGPDKPGELVPHNFRWIACYPVNERPHRRTTQGLVMRVGNRVSFLGAPGTGGSEGHYIHIDFMVPAETVEIADPHDQTGWGKKIEVHPIRTENGLWRHVRLALGKTFKGMDHAADISRRCAILLGA
jgi:hypothetical protein